MHEIVITREQHSSKYMLPATWQDVAVSDWAAISLLFLLGDSPPIRLKVLSWLMKTPKGNTIPEGILRSLAPWQLRELGNLLEWMVQERMASQPFEYVRAGKGEKLYLPDDGLRNVTLIEYAFLDLFYMVYVDAVEKGEKELAEQHLHKLIAYMCRPMKRGLDPKNIDPETWDGDVREKFNTGLCDRRIEDVKNLSAGEKLAVLMFFTGSKAAIHKAYAGTVFPQTEDDKGNKVHTGATAMEPTAWLDMCFALAGGIFGTLEQTMYTNLFTVLRHLQLQELQNLNKKRK